MSLRQRHFPRSTGQGFSLIETLVALGLASVILTVSANIMTSYTRLTRTAQARSEQADVAQLGLHTLATWLRQSPAWGAYTADSISFQRYAVPPSIWLQPAADGTWSAGSPQLWSVTREEDRLVGRCSDAAVVLCSGISEFRMAARDSHWKLRVDIRGQNSVYATVLRPQ